jgi:hypothetical protein
MFFSRLDAPTSCKLVEDAGLEIVQSEIFAEEEHGETARFLWIIARRPAPGFLLPRTA